MRVPPDTQAVNERRRRGGGGRGAEPAQSPVEQQVIRRRHGALKRVVLGTITHVLSHPRQLRQYAVTGGDRT